MGEDRNELINMCLDAALDERLSDGSLYRKAAEQMTNDGDELIRLRAALTTERAASAAFKRQTERIRERYKNGAVVQGMSDALVQAKAALTALRLGHHFGYDWPNDPLKLEAIDQDAVRQIDAALEATA